ncbi:hypothetical protein [Geomicrobium sp. JCM 19055]|uniref:hypothetical protein n=1 Tax=Geomicrobium sp. JCM 19055 TaxID=1460649 RepID=UPI00045ED9C4|nr:hypothetical protein [Geomicrobium sp. JCM 19055]GAJ97381.1 membrane protein [Geomicrobium sp. JCM 19055]
MNVLRIITVIVSSIMAGLVSARAVLTLFEPVYETWEIAPWRVVIFSLVFIASFALFFYQMVYERRSFLSFLKRPIHLVVIAILTYLFYFSTVGEMVHLEEEGSIGPVPIIIIAVLTYVLLIWAVMYRMIATDWHFYWKKHQPSPWTIVYFGLPIVLIGFIYWIGFFPGPMTPDSFHHWRQSLDYDFSNWHPMIYTVLTIVLTSIWDNPAIVTLFQVLFIGAVWGYTMFSLRRIGLPYIALIVATVIITIIPITGIYAVTFWKDVLYSVLLLLFTVYFMNIVISKGTWLAIWRNVILLTVTMLALAFFPE